MNLKPVYATLLSSILALGLIGLPTTTFAHNGGKDRHEYRHHERWHHHDHARWEGRYGAKVVRRSYREPAYVVTERVYPAYRPHYRDGGLTIIYRDVR
ncbi:MAG: hypothetical protein WCA32_19970 [Chromatiaceae bacterium]|jgi:hypothetical protein